MSEGGGITELQVLEEEISALKVQLKGAEDADPTSVVGPKLVESIKAKEGGDAFLVKEGGSEEVNQFHISENSDGGCCVVM